MKTPHDYLTDFPVIGQQYRKASILRPLSVVLMLLLSLSMAEARAETKKSVGQSPQSDTENIADDSIGEQTSTAMHAVAYLPFYRPTGQISANPALFLLMKRYGINTLYLPLNPAIMRATGRIDPLNRTALADLHEIIEVAQEVGLQVVVDVLAIPPEQVDGLVANVKNSEAEWESFSRFVTFLARQLRQHDQSHLVLGLMITEPTTSPDAVDMLQVLIKQVKKDVPGIRMAVAQQYLQDTDITPDYQVIAASSVDAQSLSEPLSSMADHLVITGLSSKQKNMAEIAAMAKKKNLSWIYWDWDGKNGLVKYEEDKTGRKIVARDHYLKILGLKAPKKPPTEATANNPQNATPQGMSVAQANAAAAAAARNNNPAAGAAPAGETALAPKQAIDPDDPLQKWK
ncbi:MAG: hypothetical protein ACOYK8_02730 [Alphaproteobacteria bacterium]